MPQLPTRRQLPWMHSGWFVWCAWVCLSLWACLAPRQTIAGEPLRLGIHPFLGTEELNHRFTPLTDYLTRTLGQPVLLFISPNYARHIEALGTGRIDIALLGPVPYVEAVKRYGAFPLLARYEIDGRTSYRGVLVVRKDSAVQSIADLRGRPFVFGDPESTMSRWIPLAMLHEAGIAEDDLGKTAFVANHDNVALGVLSGQFAAGGLHEDAFERYQGEGLRPLAWSQPVGTHVFVARKGMDPRLVAALRDALLRLTSTEEGSRTLERMQPGATALRPADDIDYTELRALLAPLLKMDEHHAQ